MYVSYTVRGKIEIILQNAGQVAGLFICCTEGQEFIVIADLDRSVGLQPLGLLLGEPDIRPGVSEELLIQLHVIEAVFILYTAHGVIKVGEEIGTVFVNRKEEIRGAYLIQRHSLRGIHEGVDRDIGVKLAVVQHLQRLFLDGRDLDQLSVDVVLLCPIII